MWRSRSSNRRGNMSDDWEGEREERYSRFRKERDAKHDCPRNGSSRRERRHPKLKKCDSKPPSGMSADFKTYADQACRAAEEFVSIYYDTMDKRRRALIRLYLDRATLIWNGNVVTGLSELRHFFEMLPSSQFQVNMLDCQPVHEHATQCHSTVLVVTSGTVKFDGNKQHYFNQNFLLTAPNASNNNKVWKIASDCFRFQDWSNSR